MSRLLRHARIGDLCATCIHNLRVLPHEFAAVTKAMWRLLVCVTVVLPAVFVAAVSTARAQSSAAPPVGATPSSGLSTAHADVVVFVNVLSADTASIGVAYDSKVSHEQVREDLSRLLQETGWGAERNLQISDASVHPDRLDRYPITTAALLSLVHAPQVVRGAPALRPYLVAFQRVSHVEVNFILPELTPYLGFDSLDNKSLAVELFHTQQGVYRFEALIRDHSGPLPALAQAAPPPSSPTGTPSTAPQTGHFNPWSVVLMVAGAGLIVCACIYPFWLRRLPGRLSTRPAVRR